MDSVILGISAGETTSLDLSDALCQIFSSIGEPDGIYGCGSVLVSDDQRCTDMHLREQEWAQSASASMCSLRSSTSSASAAHSLTQSLIQMNLLEVAHAFLTSERKTNSEDYYETALMLSKWDVDVAKSEDGINAPFYQNIYRSCSALHQGNHPASIAHKNNAIEGLFRDIEILPQSAYSLTPVLAKMKMIHDLDVVSRLLVEDSSLSDWDPLLREWKDDYDLFASQDFFLVQNVFLLKSTLLRTARDFELRRQSTKQNDDSESLTQTLAREDAKLTFRFCKVARLKGKFMRLTATSLSALILQT